MEVSKSVVAKTRVPVSKIPCNIVTESEACPLFRWFARWWREAARGGGEASANVSDKNLSLVAAVWPEFPLFPSWNHARGPPASSVVHAALHISISHRPITSRIYGTSRPLHALLPSLPPKISLPNDPSTKLDPSAFSLPADNFIFGRSSKCENLESRETRLKKFYESNVLFSQSRKLKFLWSPARWEERKKIGRSCGWYFERGSTDRFKKGKRLGFRALSARSAG